MNSITYFLNGLQIGLYLVVLDQLSLIVVFHYESYSCYSCPWFYMTEHSFFGSSSFRAAESIAIIFCRISNTFCELH